MGNEADERLFDSRANSASAPNPYAVTTDLPALENQVPSSRESTWRTRTCLFFIYTSFPLLLIGAGLAWNNVVSIIFSGGIMFCIGVLVIWLTRSKSTVDEESLRVFRWFGVACIGYPIVVFLTIFVCQWSPTEAQVPISYLTAVAAAVLILGLSASLMIYRARQRNAVFQDLDVRSAETESPVGGSPFAS